jgi:uncharacterized protein (TIGR00369 family)
MTTVDSRAGAILPIAAVRSDHHCFGCGDVNPIGLHLRFSAVSDSVTAAFVPTAEHQGFQGVVHGGIISTVLDEAMAWATAHAGIWAVTGEMRVRYRRPLRVGEATIVTARVTGSRGRIVFASAELVLDGSGAQVAKGTATFARVSDEVAAEWQTRYLERSDAE